MPEMKRNFTKGKMNKDLDERLVPPGEYRDAMNIQVSTSEGSDVGTIQNVLGNTPGCVYNDPAFPNPILPNSTTVGSVSDEKHDTLYWLVAGPNNIEDVLPLVLGQQETLKDMIMRTGPLNETNDTGCEPVFVDKHGWCIGIDDDGSGNSINTLDPILYSNITIGMELYGYSGSTMQFGPAVVTSIGSLNELYPINYFQEFSTVVNPPTTSGGVLTRLRMFEHPNLSGQFSRYYDSGVSTYASPAASTPGLNQAGNAQTNLIQLISTMGTLPFEFQIGAVVDDGAFLMGGVITNITYDWVCYVGNDIGTNANSCSQNYIITIDTTNASVFDYSALTPYPAPNGPSTWQGEFYAFPPINVTATFDPADNDYATNTIEVLPSSDQWLDEIYNLLWDGGVPTGIDLRITGPAAIYFPANTCIDPYSVDDVGDGFSPPTSYDNRLEIIGCQFMDDGTPNSLYGASLLGLAPGMGNKPITLTASGPGLESIFLNTSVDLSTSDALCFTSERVLEFERENLITGINIIDDMLFWTDNFTEPKKINIPRSVAGTESMGETHTAVVNNATGLNLANYNPIRKEHITVIRKSPKNALELELSTGLDPLLNYSGITYTSIDPVLNSGVNLSSIISSSNNTVISDFSTLSVGDKVQFEVETDINGLEDFTLQWNEGDIILLKEFDIDSLGVATIPAIPLSNYTIRGRITNWQWNSFVNDTTHSSYVSTVGSDWPTSAPGTAHVEIEVLNLNGTPPGPSPDNAVPESLNYVVDIEPKTDPIFEDKFPRFSYRYKYAGGEYSTFAPWSQVAFLPSNFNYEPKRGWNKGMTNHLTSVKFKRFVPTVVGQPLGQDVVEIDILYKEEGSPNVYVVESISPLDIVPTGSTSAWWTNEYELNSEAIKSVLPSNQLLRPWDNVPKKALAQEVSGNRIIYGNYEQNFDLLVNNNKFKPEFKNYLSSYTNITSGQVEKSIKSLREYKLGVVFTDEYGRETPILISESGGFKVDKINSESANKLVAGLDGVAPADMMYFKFFIKETSSEYYNLAMDRWYQAEDGNIWLSFPSTDRNKVDLETSLYFKKGDGALENKTRYKILAIENEAPEWIKTRKVRIGQVFHNVASGNRLFGTGVGAGELVNAPDKQEISFDLDYVGGLFAGTSISKLEDIKEDIYIQFASPNNYSSQYKVSEITSDYDPTLALTAGNPSKYHVSLEVNLEEDINFIFDDPANPQFILDNISIKFTKAVVENKPIFNGKFFAKIENNGEIKIQASGVGVNYLTRASRDIYLLDNDEELKERSLQAAMSSLFQIGNYSSVGPSSYNLENAITRDYSGYVPPGTIYFPSTTGTLNSVKNLNGENWNNWYARCSYFNSIPEVGFSGLSFSYVTPYQSGVGTWFVDRSTHKKNTSSGNDGSINTLLWPVLGPNVTSPFFPNIDYTTWTTTSSIGPGVSHGSDYSSMSLSRGGLGFLDGPAPGIPNHGQIGNYSTKNTQGLRGLWENFFAVGVDGVGHTYTNGQDEVQFVDRLKAGFSFKWEDDPTETIYTFFNQRNIYNHMRFSRHDFRMVDTETFGIYDRSSPFRSTGTYHRRFHNFLEPAMTGWDPAGPLGTFMQNGLDLRDITLLLHDIKSSGANCTGVCSYDVNVILVDKIKSKCYNGNSDFSSANPREWSLKKGMMLQYHSVSSVGSPSVAPTGTLVPNQNMIIKDITPVNDGQGGVGGYMITLTGYKHPLHYYSAINETGVGIIDNQNLVFRQVTMNGASTFTESNTDKFKDYWTNDDESDKSGGIGAVGYKMIMVEPVDEYSEGSNFPEDPYVWETEPKDDTGLDIYYEISENNPITLSPKTIINAIPTGSAVENTSGNGLPDWSGITVTNNVSALGDTITLGGFTFPTHPPGAYITVGLMGGVTVQPLQAGDYLKITKPNGVSFDVRVAGVVPSGIPFLTTEIILDTNIYGSDYYLDWHNCYSFGNGVESNRIKDNFNLPFILSGVKASTTLDIEYKKERREYGFIYSGLYNSMSGVNNLNQFIQAEKITKDINPNYGSIQKLKAGWGQSGDLIALCEDRVLKILANKDALFNADGNTNVTATNRVLGTAMPYSGEYGISTNPESFASESYRAYFTDKVRGTVMRLSMDGLTPISEFGMKDWFRDNLKLNNNIIGSYDDKKDEYNISLENTTENIGKSVTFKENVKGWVSFKSFITNNGISCANEYYTFKDANLWKHNHDVPGNRNTFYGTFNANSYSTFKVILNDAPGIVKSFYTLNYEGSQSKVDQLVIDPITGLSDGEYYNLNMKKGWYVDNVETNKEKGSLNEFIEKEGKWFNYIRGENIFLNPDSSIHLENDGYSTWDQDSFAIQGLGALNGAPSPATVLGCVDPTATNYGCAVGNMPPCFDSPNLDGGNCFYTDPIDGCITAGGTAVNNDCIPGNTSYPCGDGVTADDGSCLWIGCTNPLATNYASSYGGTFPAEAVAYNASYPGAIFDDGSCIMPIYGCIDNTMYNYNPSATVDDGSCIAFSYGCLGQNNILATQATNYNIPPGINTDDGSCEWSFCSNPLDANYNAIAVTESAAYSPQNGVISSDCASGGCMDANADNYVIDANGDAINPLGNVITYDDGSCIIAGCTWNGGGAPAWSADVPDPQNNYGANDNYALVYGSNTPQPAAGNYNSNANQEDGSCIFGALSPGCTDATAGNYDPLANSDDGSCCYGNGCVYGCMDTIAANYDPTANVDDGTCWYNVGCTDASAINYDPVATVDDGSCIASCQPYTINSSTSIDPTSVGSNDGQFELCFTAPGGPNWDDNNLSNPFTWDVVDANNVSIPYIVSNEANWVNTGCITFFMFEAGWYGLTLSDTYGCPIVDPNIVFQITDPPVYGCTDPNDYYYNILATADDGTCSACDVDLSIVNTWVSPAAQLGYYSNYPYNLPIEYPANSGTYYQNVFAGNGALDFTLSPGNYGSIWLPCDPPITPACSSAFYQGAWSSGQQMTYVTGDTVLGSDGYYYIAAYDLTGTDNPYNLYFNPAVPDTTNGGGGSPWVLCQTFN